MVGDGTRRRPLIRPDLGREYLITEGPDAAGLGFDPPGLTVDVRQVGSTEWMLLSELRYTGNDDMFVVPGSALSDFASVPRIFVWFIPAYGKYTKAAILHDHLCRQADAGQFSRRDADGIFGQALRLQNVAFLRRWVMWTAVRWGALASKDGRKDWWKDAALVLTISLLVSVILVPPALAIVAALLVWYAIELVAWAGLWMACRLREQMGQPSKRVVRPRLSLRM